MKIIQISSVLEPNTGDEAVIYGLGDDGQVYWWDVGRGEWHIHIIL